MKKTLLFAVLFGFAATFATPALAADSVQGEATQGTLTLKLFTERTAAIDLGLTSDWYIAGNNNPEFADASIDGTILTLTAKKPGFATIKACNTASSDCMNVSVGIQQPGENTGDVLGLSTFQNGSLVLDGQTIYAVYKNSKIPFTNFEAFTSLGFQAQNAVSGSAADLPDSGYMVTTAEASHPFGSWVVNNGTVYFVHELGIIPVPTWDLFLQNGGSQQLLLSANTYDMQLPNLNLLIENDSRLRVE